MTYEEYTALVNKLATTERNRAAAEDWARSCVKEIDRYDAICTAIRNLLTKAGIPELTEDRLVVVPLKQRVSALAERAAAMEKERDEWKANYLAEVDARQTAEASARAASEAEGNAAELEERIAALEEKVPYPWCPGCKSECHSVDEDGCCDACGADVVWPTAAHVGRVAALEDALTRRHTHECWMAMTLDKEPCSCVLLAKPTSHGPSGVKKCPMCLGRGWIMADPENPGETTIRINCPECGDGEPADAGEQP